MKIYVPGPTLFGWTDEQIAEWLKKRNEALAKEQRPKKRIKVQGLINPQLVEGQ